MLVKALRLKGYVLNIPLGPQEEMYGAEFCFQCSPKGTRCLQTAEVRLDNKVFSPQVSI